jgi:phage shock protein PspC (stress-responsive transcriptional regulator)
VCGGIAAYTGIDAVVVRIIAVLFLLMGHGLLLYAVLWLFLPVGEDQPSAFDRHRERRRQRRNPTPRWEQGPIAA